MNNTKLKLVPLGSSDVITTSGSPTSFTIHGFADSVALNGWLMTDTNVKLETKNFSSSNAFKSALAELFGYQEPASSSDKTATLYGADGYQFGLGDMYDYDNRGRDKGGRYPEGGLFIYYVDDNGRPTFQYSQ